MGSVSSCILQQEGHLPFWLYCGTGQLLGCCDRCPLWLSQCLRLQAVSTRGQCWKEGKGWGQPGLGSPCFLLKICEPRKFDFSQNPVWPSWPGHCTAFSYFPLHCPITSALQILALTTSSSLTPE